MLTEVAEYESQKKAVEQKSNEVAQADEDISSEVAELTSGVHSLDSLVESALPVESVPGVVPQVESQLEKRARDEHRPRPRHVSNSGGSFHHGNPSAVDRDPLGRCRHSSDSRADRAHG